MTIDFACILGRSITLVLEQRGSIPLEAQSSLPWVNTRGINGFIN